MWLKWHLKRSLITSLPIQRFECISLSCSSTCDCRLAKYWLTNVTHSVFDRSKDVYCIGCNQKYFESIIKKQQIDVRITLLYLHTFMYKLLWQDLKWFVFLMALQNGVIFQPFKYIICIVIYNTCTQFFVCFVHILFVVCFQWYGQGKSGFVKSPAWQSGASKRSLGQVQCSIL